MGGQPRLRGSGSQVRRVRRLLSFRAFAPICCGVSEQFVLFDSISSGPEGLRHVDDFVTATVERQLIRHVAALPLQPFQFGAFEGKRRVASFGFRYDDQLHKLKQAEPIPLWLQEIAAQVEAFGGKQTAIAQVLCTEYDRGVGIGWHRDKPHFGRVFGLSLGSPCRLRFRRKAGGRWERYVLEARPRSLYEMNGPSRRQWEHSIPPVEAPRYSIFRTMADFRR
jgi:alkylated DNA repair dioxygenase AlkB